MNWFESERNLREHVLRAEKASRHYPHIAHLLQRESTRRRTNQAMVALGGLLVTWGNHLQERWTVEIPGCTSTPIANN